MKLVKFLLAVVIVSTFLVFQSGCNPEANIALNFSADETQAYKAVSLSRKTYLFDQPRDKKKTEKMTEVKLEMVYDQKIESVDQAGNADAAITIKALKYLSRDNEGIDTDFDSTKPDSKPRALANLVGQSYRIKIAPDGKVISASGLENAQKAVSGREAAKLAKGILDNKAVLKIHTINALPDLEKNKLKAGDSWIRQGSSPKSALVAKSFDKNYTVKDIKETPDGMIADISMNATPASTTADKAQANYGSMGVFGNMFESDDSFTGQLKLNLDSGEVLSYHEKFAGTYTAVQFPKDDPNADPDKLQLGYTEIHSIDAVD